MNDDEWRRGVDEHLIRDLIEDLQERVRELDIILRGEKGKSGLIAEYDRHDEKLTKLYAVIFQDPTGQKGVLHDIDVLMGRRKYDNQSREFKWKFATEVTVKILTLAGILFLGWDKMEALYQKIIHQKLSPLEQKIEKARHPKSPKKIYRVRVVPAPAAPPLPQTPPPPPASE